MYKLKVAVIGNPNTGKSTLINAIAGTKLRVGNWPGVTVEKKSAELTIDDVEIELVDLPGVYTLSPQSVDERIAVDFILRERPDVIIDVIDAANLERNLYLLIELLEIGIPIVIALNMFDEATKLGYSINVASLENILGVRVIPTIAIKDVGVKEILEFLKAFAKKKDELAPKKVRYEGYGGNLVKIKERIKAYIEEKLCHLAGSYPPIDFLVIKVIEGDEYVLKLLGLEYLLDDPGIKALIKELSDFYKNDPQLIVGEARYAIARGLYREVVRREKVDVRHITERIDGVVLNRYFQIPVFLALMWLFFKISFDFTKPICEWFSSVVDFLAKWTGILLESAGAEKWFISLITDGVIGGVGSVVSFVPLVAMVMFLITFMEGSGIIARVAFIVDRFTHLVGLHGKSFIPLVIGFGCNVPSVFATRILDSERDRKLTTFLIPSISCGARLPVYMMLIGAIFPDKGATIIWFIYSVSILSVALVGSLLNKLFFRTKTPVLIMELPPYRIPTTRFLLMYTWEKLKHFLYKAGTFILVTSVIIWLLINVPLGVSKEESLLAKVSKPISILFRPMELDKWEIVASLIAGIPAKELIISTFSVVSGIQEESTREERKESFSKELVELTASLPKAVYRAFSNLFSLKPTVLGFEEEASLFNMSVKKYFTPSSAIAFMVFVLLYWPCAAFMAAVISEFGFGLLVRIVALYTVLPWLISFIVYNVAKFIS